MKLIGATYVLNEEKLVPYVMPYVEKMGYDKFIVYDDGCTDNTLNLLKEYPFVEIREGKRTNVDSFEDRKLHAMNSTIEEALQTYAYKGGEDVWFSFTDFDEVIYCQREREQTAKGYLELLTMKGYNYYDGRMLHLSWDGTGKTDRLPHTWSGTRGTWWMMEGRKVTLINLTMFKAFKVFCGNHVLCASPREGVHPMNLADEGSFNGFHFKYFLPNEGQDIRLVDNADNSIKVIRETSFPLSDYFLMKGFFVQKTPPNNRDYGEGFVLM